MLDLTILKAAQLAAFTAWQACADKPAGPKAVLAAKLAAAASTAAAAKRAAAVPAAAEQPDPELVARAVARAAEVAEFRIGAASHDAYSVYSAAAEWPRCAEGWPNGKAERVADALLKAEGYFSR